MAESKLSDSQKSAILLDCLANYYAFGGNGTPKGPKLMAARYVFLTEVADTTGFAPGYADAVAVSLWGSDGMDAHGYEIKASRADLNRELGDLSKWERIGRYCARWTLVVWDRRWLDDPRIPETWGLDAYDTASGAITEVRRPQPLNAEEWPRRFVAALVRRAAEASPGSALLSQMYEHGKRQGESTGRRERSGEVLEITEPLLPLYRTSGVRGAAYATSVPVEWVVEQLQRTITTERVIAPEGDQT